MHTSNDFVKKTSGDVLWFEPAVANTSVTLGFFERHGGVSPEPYNSLNVGGLTHDALDNVAANRAIVLESIGAPQLYLALHQVHGAKHVVLTEEIAQNPLLFEALRVEAEEGADAIISTAHSASALIVTADCAPVAIVANGGFALAHCGWKGALATCEALCVPELARLTHTDPKEMHAFIGPCIGASDFEVSEELADTFVRRYGSSVEPSKNHIDLAKVCEINLISAGLVASNIHALDISTKSHTQDFFSYRADGPNTGRLATVGVVKSQRKIA